MSLAALACLALTAGSAHAANILINGDFETDMGAEWSADSGIGQVTNVGNGQGGSDRYVDLGGGTYLYQSFTVASAMTVDFGGWFSPRDGDLGGGQTYIYDATNTTQLHSSPYVSATGNTSPWLKSETLGIVLGAGTYVFRSSFDDSANTDSVFVDATPVPEPTTTALLGLGGLALILRRRKG